MHINLVTLAVSFTGSTVAFAVVWKKFARWLWIAYLIGIGGSILAVAVHSAMKWPSSANAAFGGWLLGLWLALLVVYWGPMRSRSSDV